MPPLANPGLRLPILVSPTRVELGARCHRRHILSDFLLLKSFESPSAAFGTQLHKGTFAWWDQTLVKGISHAEAYEATISATLEKWPSAASRGYHSEALARTMIERYMEEGSVAAAATQDGWQVLDMERRFAARLMPAPSDIEPSDETAPLDSYPIITFKIDRILENQERGTLMIVDTKTSARMDENWTKGMRRAIQLRLYTKLAASFYDRPVEYTYVEGLAKKGYDGAGIGYVNYEWVNRFWTPAYLDEAVSLASDVASADLLVLMQAYLEAGLDFDSDDADLTAALMEHAATQTSFNLGDCRSYWQDCPFMEACDSSPEERLALLQDPSNFWQAEPWQTDLVDVTELTLED